VWAHNSHIGDARATEMGKIRDELNIGQLCREAYGAEARLLGFGTDRGTVAAASDWDGPMEIKNVRPAHEDSYEWLCRESGRERFLLDLSAESVDALHYALLQPRLERAIGVIYRPETELLSHYFEAQLPRQFDAWLWFEQTSAVTPLGTAELSGAPGHIPSVFSSARPDRLPGDVGCRPRRRGSGFPLIGSRLSPRLPMPIRSGNGLVI
jgi:erythromycin esterase-like protein